MRLIELALIVGLSLLAVPLAGAQQAPKTPRRQLWLFILWTFSPYCN